MNNIDDISKVFTDRKSILSQCEYFDSFKIEFSSDSINIPTESELLRIVNFLRSINSNMLLDLKLDEDEYQNIFDSKNYNYQTILNHINGIIELADSDSIYYFLINIDKNRNEHILPIFNYDIFMNYLESLKFEQLLSVIYENLRNGRCLYVPNFEINEDSDVIHISNDLNKLEKIEITIKKFLNAKDYVNIHSKVELIPNIEIFTFKKDSEKRIILLLRKVQFVLSCCLLSNHAEINGDKVELHFNGMKKLYLELIFSKLSIDNDNSIYKICTWAFSGSEIEDKLGIIRNVFSITIENKSELCKSDNYLFESILSNHQIYLRDNVHQYIEIKSKIVEQVLEIIKESMKISDGFISNLKSNYVAFFTFFITVIIFNSISTGKINNIFTQPITFITYSLLLISFFILILSILEIRYKWKRQAGLIENIKEEYSDILNRKDLENICNKSSVNIDNSRLSLIKSTIGYSIIWLLTLIIIFFVTQYLYRNNPFRFILCSS